MKTVARTLGDRLREAGLPATDEGRAALRRREALAPWTEAHRREATARTYEIAADIVRREGMGPRTGAAWIAKLIEGNVFNEESWRGMLRPGNAGFAPDRVDREVRRVRALAEGRLVRETTWFVRYRNGTYSQTVPTREQAVEIVDKAKSRGERARLVSVTRIRRA